MEVNHTKDASMFQVLHDSAGIVFLRVFTLLLLFHTEDQLMMVLLQQLASKLKACCVIPRLPVCMPRAFKA